MSVPGTQPIRVVIGLALAALVLLSLACAPATPRFDRVRLVAELRRPLADWCSYWRGYDSTFALDSLRWSIVDSIHVERTEALPDSARTSAASRWYAWSADRMRAVDPDRNRTWDADAKRFAYEASATSELLDLAAHTRSILRTCGGECRNDDAAWLDRERFVLMGWQDADNGDSLFEPVVSVYDLARRTTASGTGRAVRLHP